MTTATLTAPLPRSERRHDPIGRRYGRMWARVPRELAYLALVAVIGLVAFSVASAATSVSGGVLVVVAVVLLALVLLGARYVATFELDVQRWARLPEIPRPAWTPPFRGKRPLRALGDVFANGHYWLYGLHTGLLNPLLAGVSFSIWFGWALTGLGLVSFAAWGLPPFLADAVSPLSAGLGNDSIADQILGAGTGSQVAVDPVRAAWLTAGFTAIGALMLALFPFVTRGMSYAHWGLGRLLLARFRSEDLEADVARVDAARVAAVSAEDTALRRLERDIHDGPQQRLLALQMELATAERRIEQDGDATEAIATARRLAAETLDELRALAQGFAPPLLQDRGLSAALGALGRRGALPVETAIALPADLPDAVERSVYFVAAELVTNAVKHSGATRVRLEATADGGDLRVAVTDDGIGGAHPEPGHGLAGAAERLAGLGGALTVDSPEGGPTTVTARVPLP